MLSLKFLETIKQRLTAGSVDRLSDKISTLNPDKMYLENIRYVMGLPSIAVKAFCQLAVRTGILKECVEYQCPQCGKAIKDSCSGSSILDSVVCTNCILNEEDVHEFRSKDCIGLTFYKSIN